MKLAFIGTHGTGKTTLAYSVTGELKRIGKNATMITEVARKCPLPINENGTINSQLWMMSSQIAEELEADHRFSHVVCDRSILDSYAYGIYSFGDNDLLKKLVEHWIGTYDILFRVPIRHNLVPDGFRSVNANFQKDVDLILLDLLNKHNVPFIELPQENQIQFVIERVHELEKKGQQKITSY